MTRQEARQHFGILLEAGGAAAGSLAAERLEQQVRQYLQVRPVTFCTGTAGHAWCTTGILPGHQAQDLRFNIRCQVSPTTIPKFSPPSMGFVRWVGSVRSHVLTCALHHCSHIPASWRAKHWMAALHTVQATASHLLVSAVTDLRLRVSSVFDLGFAPEWSATSLSSSKGSTADAAGAAQCMFHTWRDCFPLFHGYSTLLIRETAGVKAPLNHSDRLLVRVLRLIPHPAQPTSCAWVHAQVDPGCLPHRFAFGAATLPDLRLCLPASTLRLLTGRVGADGRASRQRLP